MGLLHYYLSLAIHVYTLANKKAFVKLFWSNKLKSASHRKNINLLLFPTQTEERLFSTEACSHSYLRTSRRLLTTRGSALLMAIALQKRCDVRVAGSQSFACLS